MLIRRRGFDQIRSGVEEDVWPDGPGGLDKSGALDVVLVTKAEAGIGITASVSVSLERNVARSDIVAAIIPIPDRQSCAQLSVAVSRFELASSFVT